jgi:cell division protein FtsL
MPRAATAAARTAPAPAQPRRAPRRAPQRPARRVSGPSSRAANAAASAGARVLPLPQRLELPRLGPAASGLLDRLLRGRTWVLLIGTLLVGIVFFNVDVLRLNRSIASTSAKATTLKQENARLLLLEARLASSERIQQAAAADGMVLPAPGEVRYLKVRRGDAARAAARITTPQPVPPPAATPQTQQTPGTAAPAAPPAQTVPTSGATGAMGPTTSTPAQPPAATSPGTTSTGTSTGSSGSGTGSGTAGGGTGTAGTGTGTGTGTAGTTSGGTGTTG